MLILSGIIASYGLLTNSAPVVIGTMLVAPLMTPIIGSALSLSYTEKFSRIGCQPQIGGRL
ncbi:MAG: hypothetical protein PHR16_04480 [Methylovulum sp.]|nr:hypothetical protein [Methylovulum sp.]